MARRAGPPLPDAAEHRIARLRRDIEKRQNAAHVVDAEEFGIRAVDLHGVDGARRHLHLRLAMGERDDAALGQHDVVVEIAAEPLIELQGHLVERRALGEEIVGAHDGGVAPGIAAAEPALLDDRDIADIVRLGEVIGRRQTMTAAADDQDVVARFRLRRAPGLLPALLAPEAFLEEREYRIVPGHRAPARRQDGKAECRVMRCPMDEKTVPSGPPTPGPASCVFPLDTNVQSIAESDAKLQLIHRIPPWYPDISACTEMPVFSRPAGPDARVPRKPRPRHPSPRGR